MFVVVKRTPLLDTLKLVSRAAIEHKFIPVLADVCFKNKRVTAYNDVFAISTSCDMPYNIGVNAAALIRLLTSFTQDTVSLRLSDDKLFLRTGRTNTTMVCRLAEEFIFNMPAIDKLKSRTLTDDATMRFIRGLKLCMLSVEETTNAFRQVQLGVTVHADDTGLVMYGTNNNTLSRYVVSQRGNPFTVTAVLPADFCRALVACVPLISGTTPLVLRFANDYAVFQIGDCTFFTKTFSNREGIDFEKVIKHHAVEAPRVNITVEFREMFERCKSFMYGVVNPLVRLQTVDRTQRVILSAENGKQKYSDASVFQGQNVMLPHVDYRVNVKHVNAALDKVNTLQLGVTAITLEAPRFTYLLSTTPLEREDESPPTYRHVAGADDFDDDIPF